MEATNVKQLTVIECVALAFAEYGHNRFTTKALTSYLCSLLADPFKIKTMSVVEELMQEAVSIGACELSSGERGGVGFIVSQLGVDLAADVILPNDRIAQQAKRESDRCVPANANAGSIFDALLPLIADDHFFAKDFVESLFAFWQTKGWLSGNQVSKLSEIATRHGFSFEQHQYVGFAKSEWTAPYVRQKREERQRRIEEQKAVAGAEAAKRQRVDESNAIVRDHNRKIKMELKGLASAGALAEVDALVAAVFPTANCDEASKARAFGGGGLKDLRVCVTMVAYGKPPSEVWQQIGHVLQPDAESYAWLKLIAHPACHAIIGRHARTLPAGEPLVSS